MDSMRVCNGVPGNQLAGGECIRSANASTHGSYRSVNGLLAAQAVSGAPMPRRVEDLPRTWRRDRLSQPNALDRGLELRARADRVGARRGNALPHARGGPSRRASRPRHHRSPSGVWTPLKKQASVTCQKVFGRLSGCRFEDDAVPMALELWWPPRRKRLGVSALAVVGFSSRSTVQPPTRRRQLGCGDSGGPSERRPHHGDCYEGHRTLPQDRSH